MMKEYLDQNDTGVCNESLHIGPILTDENGELDTPILRCSVQGLRCKHLGIHEQHYFYCSAQDAPNQHVAKSQYAYPWAGAGALLPRGPYPHNCPHDHVSHSMGKLG